MARARRKAAKMPAAGLEVRISKEETARLEAAAARVKAAIEIGEACFARLCREFGETTARLVMKRCAEITKAPTPPAKPARKRQDVKLPAAAEIETTMTDHRVRILWRRIQDNKQVFEGDQKQSFVALAKRYRKCDGYQGGIPPAPPPLKENGAKRRTLPKAAELPAMFEAVKREHPRWNKPRIADHLAEQHGTIYGKSADAIERAEREWRKKNRKVWAKLFRPA